MEEEIIDYKRVKTNVDLTPDELRTLLTKHQLREPLSTEENRNLWQYIANFTRSLERKFFGKQDSSTELDLHHERILYVHDYLRERRRFEREETCYLQDNGKMKCKTIWVPNLESPPPPFSMLYKLKMIWQAHEAMLRLGAMGIDFSTFELTGERNRFELAESVFIRYDVVTVLKIMRIYETYDREELITLSLNANERARRFRKWSYAENVMGVEPFVDLLLFAVGHRYGYKQLDEGKLSYDYFKPLVGSTGRKVWTQSTANL